jgi:hypothetical protein
VDLSEIVAALSAFTRDTINGLAVFVVPGPDAYSLSQGVSHPDPGAMESQVSDYLLLGIDFSTTSPELLSRPIAAALGPDLSEVRLAASRDLRLGEALDRLLGSDETVPLTLGVALLLDFLAVQVAPSSLNGPFLSPFARLSYAGKARVFESLEDPPPGLVARVGARMPESLRPALPGQLAYVGGVLLEFAAIGAYIDWAAFDPGTRTVGEFPISWRLTGYQPDGVSEGWDDFQGYYQDRQAVEF